MGSRVVCIQAYPHSRLPGGGWGGGTNVEIKGKSIKSRVLVKIFFSLWCCEIVIFESNTTPVKTCITDIANRMSPAWFGFAFIIRFVVT